MFQDYFLAGTAVLTLSLFAAFSAVMLLCYTPLTPKPEYFVLR
jgi:hypothetical protein